MTSHPDTSPSTCPYCGQAIGTSERKRIRQREAEIRDHLETERTQEAEKRVSALEKALTEAKLDKTRVEKTLQTRVALEVEKAVSIQQEEAEANLQEVRTQLQRAQKTNETLKRQLDEKPSYVRGALQEAELLARLQKEFPKDRIAKVSGAGADIEHEVMDQGESCGVILYESKNVQNWNAEFITKLNKDKLVRKASHAVLVSTAFPSKSQDFDFIDGVAVVRPELLLGLIQIIRRSVIDLKILELSGENKGFKHEQLMNYLQSADFKNKVQNVLRAVGDLEELQMKERRYHDRLWGDEDRLQKEIRNSTADVQSELTGILAGR